MTSPGTITPPGEEENLIAKPEDGALRGPIDSRVLVGLAILSFLFFVVIQMPIGVLSNALPADWVEDSAGTLYDGSITLDHDRLISGPLQLTLRATPLTLLDLTYDAQFSLKGDDIVAAGEGRIGFRGQLHLKDARFELSSRIFPIPLNGSVIFDIAAADFTAEGQCLSMTGKVTSDSFAVSRQALGGWIGPELTGVLSCKEGVPALDASGVRDRDQIMISAQMPPQGTGMDMTVTIRTDNAALKAGLKRFGFTSTPDGRMALSIKGGRNDG